MKKLIPTKILLFSILLVIILSSFSFIAYKKAEVVCTEVEESCKKRPTDGSVELFWDEISRSFVSLVTI